MQMSLRILFKIKNIDTEEEMTQYAPVAVGMDYRQAIRMLRAGSGGGVAGSAIDRQEESGPILRMGPLCCLETGIT